MKAAGALRLLALGVVLAPAARVQAQVSARLELDGNCPTATALERSLRGIASRTPDGDWGLTVSSDESATDVTLIEPDGGIALTRQLDEGSCSDRADAIAVILHAHLLDLSLVAPDALLTRPRDEPTETPAPEEPAAEPAPVEEPPSLPPPPAEPPVESAPQTPTLSGDRFFIALAGSAGFGISPSLASGALRAELGWEPGHFPLTSRVEIGGRLFEAQQEQDGELTLRGLTFAVVMSLPVHLRELWLAPLAGVGLALDFVEFSGLATQEARMRLTAGFELGWALARPFWLRFDTRVDFLPWADAYLVDPVGRVGQSPQAVLYLGLAVGLNFGDS